MLEDYSTLPIAIVASGPEDFSSTVYEWNGINHLYGYVGQNPLNYFDPLGLSKLRGDGSATGKNTSNPYKHCKEHPTDPTKIICKDKKTGKKKTVPRPRDWPGDKTEMTCEGNCQAGLVLVGGVCLIAACAVNPVLCGLAVGGGLLGVQ